MATWQEPIQKTIFSPPLSVQRYQWVQKFIEENGVEMGVKSVTDLGCGNGRMLLWLKSIKHLEAINLIDIDDDQMERQQEVYIRPNLMDLIFGRRETDIPLEVKVYTGDMTLPNDLLEADCFTMVEVIEHMLPQDVDRSMRCLFGYYQPKLAIITTPNSEFNHLLRDPGEPATTFRHHDHKFEWTRVEFLAWAQSIANNYPYSFQLDGVGHLDNSEPFGPCTQIAVFRRIGPKRTKEETERLHADLLLESLELVESSSRKLTKFCEYRIPTVKMPFNNQQPNKGEFDDW